MHTTHTDPEATQTIPSTPSGREVYEKWAPIGAARFRELVEAQFYDDTRFFRVRRSLRGRSVTETRVVPTRVYK